MPQTQKKEEKKGKPVFAGTEEASGAKMVLCGWCEKEIPADSEKCPFCKRDPRQPGAMADLLDRAETIRDARTTEDDDRSEGSERNSDPLGILGNLLRH